MSLAPLQPMPNLQREMREEIYRSMVLLGADELLLGSIASWRDGITEDDVLAELRNWNEAKVLELKEWLPSMEGPELHTTEERVQQYEASRSSE
jgi:hypothetical protein